MVSIKLENVSKIFGQVRALDGVNLDIADGEFVVFLGPSGGGKSTLLLIVAGIYKPTTGHVYFDSEDVTDLPPKDRNVGMVFQSYALYPHMTVYDNIAFPLKLKKISAKILLISMAMVPMKNCFAFRAWAVVHTCHAH